MFGLDCLTCGLDCLIRGLDCLSQSRALRVSEAQDDGPCLPHRSRAPGHCALRLNTLQKVRTAAVGTRPCFSKSTRCSQPRVFQNFAKFFWKITE